jgi:hypothetical protein
MDLSEVVLENGFLNPGILESSNPKVFGSSARMKQGEKPKFRFVL